MAISTTFSKKKEATFVASLISQIYKQLLFGNYLYLYISFYITI